MNDTTFKVFGNEDLLKNTKINIELISEEFNNGNYVNNISIKTLLNNGLKNNQIDSGEASFILVYVTYKDSLVTKYKLENIFKNANDQINHLYLNKKDNNIVCTFVFRKANLEKMEGNSKILIPKEEYFKSINISDELLIDEKKKFFEIF